MFSERDLSEVRPRVVADRLGLDPGGRRTIPAHLTMFAHPAFPPRLIAVPKEHVSA